MLFFNHHLSFTEKTDTGSVFESSLFGFGNNPFGVFELFKDNFLFCCYRCQRGVGDRCFRYFSCSCFLCLLALCFSGKDLIDEFGISFDLLQGLLSSQLLRFFFGVTFPSPAGMFSTMTCVSNIGFESLSMDWPCQSEFYFKFVLSGSISISLT